MRHFAPVSCYPSRPKAWPNSQPVLSPPRMTRRVGNSVNDQTDSLVKVKLGLSVKRGIGGVVGAAPVSRCDQNYSGPETGGRLGSGDANGPAADLWQPGP